MFPNKQRNKIKRELLFFFFFFTTKANGPKLSQPVKQCQSWLWEGEARGKKEKLALWYLTYRNTVCVCFVFTRTLYLFINRQRQLYYFAEDKILINVGDEKTKMISYSVFSPCTLPPSGKKQTDHTLKTV